MGKGKICLPPPLRSPISGPKSEGVPPLSLPFDPVVALSGQNSPLSLSLLPGRKPKERGKGDDRI